MSTAGAIRSALVARLAAIPDIGIVHDRERFAAQLADLKALYTIGTPALIRGWYVSRIASTPRRLASGRLLVQTRWGITGFASFVDADASELAVDALIGAIGTAIETEPTLGGLVRGRPIAGRQGVALAEAAPVMFAGVLCHQVKLVLETEHYEEAGAPANGPTSADGLVGRLRDRIAAEVPDLTVEGRLAWDPADDPVALPAAIVLPVNERTSGNPVTQRVRDTLSIGVDVVITTAAGYASGDGTAAANGFAALADNVRAAVHGWEGGVAFAFVYRGAQMTEAAPGCVAWRQSYIANDLIEAAS